MAFSFRAVSPDIHYVEIPVVGITSNVYVVGSPAEALLIDCGGANHAGEVIETLSANGYSPGAIRGIAVTHGHSDHYGGAAALSAWSGAPVWAHLAAAVRIEDHWADFVSPAGFSANIGPAAWEAFKVVAGENVRVARLLRDGETIEVGGVRLDVLHLPGHAHGLIGLLEPRRGLIFIGDLIQGGMDASANWLGLYHDVAAQRSSLARVAALKPSGLLKGHRRPRAGAEVQADLASAVRRLDAIEAALLDALRAQAPLTLAQATRAAFKKVLNMDVADPPNYAVLSVAAFMIHLAYRKLVRRTADLAWEPADR